MSEKDLELWKEDLKLIDKLQVSNNQKDAEIKLLKNNWNELKKYAKENLYFYSGYQGEDLEEDISIKGILEKMQELEGKSE